MHPISIDSVLGIGMPENVARLLVAVYVYLVPAPGLRALPGDDRTHQFTAATRAARLIYPHNTCWILVVGSRSGAVGRVPRTP